MVVYRDERSWVENDMEERFAEGRSWGGHVKEKVGVLC